MTSITEVNFLPTDPGCYIFRNSTGAVLYVGKAKNIKKRVSSYFQKKDHDEKTAHLVERIADVDVMVTTSEVEALLLENNLIKKYYPPYNLDLKDSRRYAYILLRSDDSLPWIEVARDRSEKGEYFGPFVSGMNRKIIMDVLSRNFRILTRRPSPRLRKTIDPAAYNERVQQARRILKGDIDGLKKELVGRMERASNDQYYEYALIVKNQIDALDDLKEKQRMEMTRAVDAQIVNYSVLGKDVFLLVFTIRRGVLEEKQEYSFEYYDGFLDDFLIQYYDAAPIPQELVVPHAVDAALAEYLSKKGRRKVAVIVPQKGDKKELLELVAHNIQTTFFAGKDRMVALQKLLGLEKMPQRIECFDISHLGGTNTVASMVSFLNGLPDKSHYRKFKVRAQTDGDDYFAMKEVVTRRYAGTLKKTMRNPDLIVIDGGLGQLGAATSSLKALGLRTPVISLAKRLEEIYVAGDKPPLRPDRKDKGLQLLQALRDEAHRFAITYQRKLRSKAIGQ